MKDFRIRFDCKLCGGILQEQLELGETPLANELPTRQGAEQDMFPLYLSRCTICQHVQLPVVVNQQRLFSSYLYQSGTSPVFVRHLQDFARDVQPKAGGFVVEIGSNDGTLLAEYKRLGFNVLGIDPAKNIAEIAEANGVPTIRAFFGRATLSNWNLMGRKADLVIANNVFAHADDLADIAEGVAMLLADDGEFVLECGYLPDMIKLGVFSVIYHEHLSFWHAQPMFSFLAAHGLHLYDAERVPTQGGSMRYYASRAPRSQSERLREILAAETPASCDVSKLAVNIEARRMVLQAILSKARAEGLTVCGYGCPAQLTTTAYALGLKRGDVKFVVDDNPLKQGRYTPGLHWPIVPPTQLYQADICIVFSGNFIADIKRRHTDFSGSWVVP